MVVGCHVHARVSWFCSGPQRFAMADDSRRFGILRGNAMGIAAAFLSVMMLGDA